MGATLTVSETLDALRQHERRADVLAHPFLRRIREECLTKEQVGVIVGQYWHPHSYFVDFLARVIAVLPETAMKTHVSQILWTELGEGDASRSHGALYVQTMMAAGITRATLTGSEALPATGRLVQRYRSCTQDPISAAAGLYGTEIIDLAVVSSIGVAVARCSGLRDLPWVTIHVAQEEGHVASVRELVMLNASPEEGERLVDEVLEMWSSWSDFYTDIERKLASS